MFDYADPVGTGVLAAQNAISEYRSIIDRFYEDAQSEPSTRFVRLERVSGTPDEEIIPWPAFPITAGVSDAAIDANRFDRQDEYVEWHVVSTAGRIDRIIFSTEFSEYYEALAQKSAAALISGIVDALPGANPTTVELFGAGFNPDQASPGDRAARFRARTVVPFNSPLGTVPPNPWNNGAKGILCLAQQFNTMGALFNLACKCAVPNSAIPATEQCASVGGACGPNRNSDPRICSRSQEVARLPRPLSLKDPVGVQILRLNGEWKIDGQQVDINNSSANGGIWRITRNGRRATLNVRNALTLNNQQIATGTQVSRVLEVGAAVVSIDPSQLSQGVAALRGVAAPAASRRVLPTRSRG